MKDEQKIIDTAVFTCVFESVKAIFKNVLTIDDMKKMVFRLNQWVEDEEKYMKRD